MLIAVAQRIRARCGVLFIIALLLSLSSCVRMSEKELAVRPDVPLAPSETADIAQALSKHYSQHDLSIPWKGELACGWSFAEEKDFYRAITCFRKSLIYLTKDQRAEPLTPSEKNQIKIEAVTGIVASYLMQKKYAHILEAWDTLSPGLSLQGQKEAKWLLIMMVAALSHVQQQDARAQSLATMLPNDDPDRIRLLAYLAVRAHSITPLIPLDANNDIKTSTEQLFSTWESSKKNPLIAGGVNTLLPGAGYAYLGQWSTAATSLSINALFIGACIEFFRAHQPMAAIITLGLEFGWWAGGAIGARLSAHEYNHRLWLEMAQKFMKAHQIYPEAILWNALTAT